MFAQQQAAAESSGAAALKAGSLSFLVENERQNQLLRAKESDLLSKMLQVCAVSVLCVFCVVMSDRYAS